MLNLLLTNLLTGFSDIQLATRITKTKKKIQKSPLYLQQKVIIYQEMTASIQLLFIHFHPHMLH